MSNRLTFSLASLILILGLVFAPTSVMAHPATDANTDTATDTAQIHPVSTATNHRHPVVEVVIADANPNTRDIEVVDKDEDTESDNLNATIEFDVTLRLPVGAQSAGSPVSALTSTIVAYGSDFLAVGTLTGNTFTQGTLADDGTFTAGTAATDLDFQANLILTIEGDAIPSSVDTNDAAAVTAANTASRTAAKADAIADGLMFDITVAADVIQMTGLAGGPMRNQANLGSMTTVTVVADETDLMPAELADMAHLVIVRDIDNPPDFGTADPDLMEWPGSTPMPDLHKLFIENTTPGGGGSLQLNVTDADGANIGARKVVITEVMWAIDEGLVGQPGADANQWIEIYNQSGGAIAHSAISFTPREGRPALAQGTDLVSNVVGAGSAWISTKGQNGNSGTVDASGQVTGQKAFVSMYRNNRAKEGWNGAHWSKSSQLFKPNYQGTPSDKEVLEPKTFTATTLARSPFIFSEVGNNSNDDYDWVEVKNVTDATQNLRNRRISIITSATSDVALVTFPDDKNYNVPAGDVFLIVKTDPSGNDDHPLAAGFNVDKKPEEQVRGVPADHPVRYKVLSGLELPNSDNDGDGFVLVLRGNNNDHLGKTNGVFDVAGYDNDVSVNTASLFTNLWPLVNFAAPWNGTSANSGNKFNQDEVYYRQHEGIDGTSATRRNRQDDRDAAFRQAHWTGIGYKRNVDADSKYGGTPGYPNAGNSLKAAGADATAAVMISEIMYAVTDRTVLQWIELRNTSDTVGVNLDLWELLIVNHGEMMDSDGMMVDFPDEFSQTVNLEGRIPPGQSYLIVSSKVTGNRRDSTNLPPERIKDAGKERSELLLNPYGFQLTIRTKRDKGVGEREEVDMVGNLMPAPEGSRRADAQSFNDAVAWNLPADVINEDGDRISVVRVPGVDSGTDQYAWAAYTMTREYDQIRNLTYYGNENDIGSPGHHHGGALPVSLSKFRPERMKDTGAVVIRWATESELNNAGFNILRSETRDGEFTKINTKLIAGQGTTSERTAYEFTDTSAKPNIVYYYQIQDVSFDGDVTTLRTTHLRGNVSAAGKLTTIWGELKALQ